MRIEIKGYRSCRSNEGDAYSYTLQVDGKSVADVQYDGWGGPVDFRWRDERAKAALYAFVQPLAVARAEAEEEAERKVAKGGRHPRGMEWGWWPKHLREDAQAALEAYLDTLQERTRVLASLKRRVKKSVVVVREGDAPGTYRTVSAPPTPENLARIAERETAKKGRVLNARPESEWLTMLGL